MTPTERAEKIVADWFRAEEAPASRTPAAAMVELIRVAIVEATNEEVEKRRDAEQTLRQVGYIVAALLAMMDRDRGWQAEDPEPRP